MKDYYLDSSAILKYIFKEKESSAIRREIRGYLRTSEIARVEVIRRVLRIEPALLSIAYQVFDRIQIVPVRSNLLSFAERLPAHINIRGMDAIHLASAAIIDEGQATLVTYDRAMAKAGEELGMLVLSPGVAL